MRVKDVVISPDFMPGDVVFLRASLGDGETEWKGTVVQIEVNDGMMLTYNVRWDDMSRCSHSSCELTRNKFESIPEGEDDEL